MNGIYFFIPFFLVFMIGSLEQVYPVESVEKGINYDREFLGVNPDTGNNVYKWTSQPMRILDGGNYVNYKVWEDETNIYYESFYHSVIFHKPTNTFESYDGGYLSNKSANMKLSHSIKESISGSGIYNDILTDTPRDTIYTVNDFGIQIISTQDDFQTIYDVRPIDFEWTYVYHNSNNSKTNHEYGVSFVCDGESCNDVKISGQPVTLGQTISKENLVGKDIKVGNSKFDLKEEQHGSTWALKKPQHNKMIIDFTDSTILNPGETLIIDPVFGPATQDADYETYGASGTGSACSSTYGSQDSSTGNIGIWDTSSSLACRVPAWTWDISSIPDSTPSVSQVRVSYELDSVTNGRNCDWRHHTGTPTADQTFYNNVVLSSGADYTTVLSNSSECTVDTGAAQIVTLSSTAHSLILADITGDDEVTLSTLFNSMTRDGSIHQVVYTDLLTQLEITYEDYTPDAVTDLTYTDITDTTVDLSWSQPDLKGGNLTGYQINYSTPWGDPSTVITNNTGTSDTTSQITGLLENTTYSFRLGVWTEYSNMSGNILNITTDPDFTIANYTPGFFDVNATNDDIIQIFFERQDINSTALFLNVTYPNTYDLACSFDYEFANTQSNYTNLSNVTISANAVESSFLFTDVDNEIINVYCWDQSNTDNDGSYLITQTSFPLLDQIANFRAGEYGTDGDFGAIDFITLAVVIISMIGFNRVNESVGAVFNIILLGSLAYFGIIELPTIIFGAIAVVLVLVVSSTRKT